MPNSEKMHRRRRKVAYDVSSNAANSPIVMADSGEIKPRIPRSRKSVNNDNEDGFIPSPPHVAKKTESESVPRRPKLVYDEDQKYLRPSMSTEA